MMNTSIQELSAQEIDEVSGAYSNVVIATGVALGTAAFGAFTAGVAAGYAIGMQIWGPSSTN